MRKIQFFKLWSKSPMQNLFSNDTSCVRFFKQKVGVFPVQILNWAYFQFALEQFRLEFVLAVVDVVQSTDMNARGHLGQDGFIYAVECTLNLKDKIEILRYENNTFIDQIAHEQEIRGKQYRHAIVNLQKNQEALKRTRFGSQWRLTESGTWRLC